ncbi:hypothetical protein GE21DRAFT_1210294, partial [Neurospora crassa]
IYINNIIIVLDTWEDYIIYFTAIFKFFTSKNISLSFKKLFLKYPNVELLEFRINSFGL